VGLGFLLMFVMFHGISNLINEVNYGVVAGGDPDGHFEMHRWRRREQQGQRQSRLFI
jgi:hypothetical protein